MAQMKNALKGTSITEAVTERENLQTALLDLLKKANDPLEKVDIAVKQEGIKLILPEKMTYEKGIEVLQRKIREEQTMVAIHEEVEAYPLDGAYALMEVLKQRFGWAQATETIRQTMFGPQSTPPTMVNLEIGHNQNTQVIWGSFVVPGVEGTLETEAGRKKGMFTFVIAGEVKQRYRKEIQELAQAVRDFVRTSSVYKGKAIKLVTNDNGDADFKSPPTFLDLSRVDERELTFSDAIAEQVQTNLFTPIERTADCRKYGVPLKRGVLLEGRYGTGKTLTAYVTAKKAEANGWTFIYLDRVSALKEAINFAKQYGPSVIFAEDIDRVVSGGRTVKVDDVLNQIDGVDSKGQELIVILTSNFVDQIDKAMLRPGRLDAVISVSAPDAKAAARLVRLYARGLVGETEDLDEAGRELDGQIPAVIREVVERSKLAAITRLKPGAPLQLVNHDLVVAAKGMKHHLELMQPDQAKATTPEEDLGIAMKKLVGLNGRGELIDHIATITHKDIANRMAGVPAFPVVHARK